MDKERGLSFELLDEWIAQYLKTEDSKSKPGPWERWTFALGLFVPGICAPVGVLLANETGLLLVRVGLIAEVVLLAVSLALLARREWATFARAHNTYAREMDGSYRLYRGIVEKLRKFSRRDIQRRLRFIEGMRGRVAYRMGLFTGGMERLGIVPVLVVLYLQFKDWRFGDWEALAKVNMVGALLLWALLISYLLSWWMVKLRNRVDLYESLLRDALAEDDGASRPERQ
ncbi:hypothetical protein GLE_2036 [Lysobacter enzymogenes]|uniref:Uncharacterized protein n=1 Tax=Lysobacter enzymogenes TaxID=69 RepID=A0A0S2DFR4_LYSEN|nr:hypothetical protein [Lysobacter enzymogenes]ALN57386.1 hypothetical protein GLE_2036 [Lysobacter enzymogenes]QCW26010.1 hypothetical protein FE772_10330 [Lysobacter enzymogenes]UZW58877.1 hypothetical protein BV903_016360 [Lysobacter enzymogenes]